MGPDLQVVQEQVHAIREMGTGKSFHREDFFKSSRPVQIVEGPGKSSKTRAMNAGEREGQKN